MQLSDQMFQLRQENEALQDQLRFKDRMIAMLAHDLRNPLNGCNYRARDAERAMG